jgi:hypothetical protein
MGWWWCRYLHEGGGGGGWRQQAVLSGHTSYLTHVDWSADGQFLQSTDGANELLYHLRVISTPTGILPRLRFPYVLENCYAE